MELTVPNRIEEIAGAAQAVERFCADHRVPRRAAKQLVLALDEVLTNVISYAWPEGGEHSVTVRLSAGARSVRVDILDDGRAFDPLEAGAPDLAATLEERQVGGLGVHFVRTLVDEVSYRRDGERNHLTLRKTFEPEEP